MLGGNIMHNKIHEIKTTVVQIVLKENILLPCVCLSVQRCICVEKKTN